MAAQLGQRTSCPLYWGNGRLARCGNAGSANFCAPGFFSTREKEPLFRSTRPSDLLYFHRQQNSAKPMLISFKNRKVGPIASAELTFARRLWVASQHVAAANDRGMDATHNVIVLFDEIEEHLHPRWQRSIVKGLRKAIPLVCEALGLRKTDLRHFLSTPSPLVISALEDEFALADAERDKWFAFDMNMSTRKVDIAEPSFSHRKCIAAKFSRNSALRSIRIWST